MNLLRECYKSLDQFVFMRDSNFILHQLEKRGNILDADWRKLPRTRWMGRIENISNGRVYRAKAPHLVHYYFVGTKRNEGRCTKSMVRHKDSKFLSVLPNEASDAPRYSS